MMYGCALASGFLSSVFSVTAPSLFVHGVVIPLHDHTAGLRCATLRYDCPLPIHRKRYAFQPSSQSDLRCALMVLASSPRVAGGDDAVTGVTLKMAFDSSDVWGVADLSETKSERFTSPESLDMVHRLRRESCAVLVGRGTVERDNCTLTVRRVELGDGKSQPVRVVVDPSLTLIGGEYAILRDDLPTIIYHLKNETSKAMQSDSVTLVEIIQPDNNDGKKSLISPSNIVKDLSSRGLRHIMVEGGPATARAFLDARVVDRAILVRAPMKFGIPLPAEMDESTLTRAGLEIIGTTRMGGDTIEYWTLNGSPWPNPHLHLWP
jgi:riboflavin-specific deaminase-like protein